MTKRLPSFASVLLLLLVGCAGLDLGEGDGDGDGDVDGDGDGDGDGTPPDPPGTVTTTLLNTQGSNCLDFRSGASAGQVDLCLSGANFAGVEYNSCDSGPSSCVGSSRIAGVGAVSGVGAIGALPEAGWVKLTTASAGQGYVVVSRFGDAYAVHASEAVTNGYTIRWWLLEAAVRTPLQAVDAVGGPGNFTLTWNAVPRAVSYTLRHELVPTGGGQGSPSPPLEPIPNVTSPHVQSGLLAGQSYRYHVSVVYPWGETPQPSKGSWPEVAVP